MARWASSLTWLMNARKRFEPTASLVVCVNKACKAWIWLHVSMGASVIQQSNWSGELYGWFSLVQWWCCNPGHIIILLYLCQNVDSRPRFVPNSFPSERRDLGARLTTALSVCTVVWKYCRGLLDYIHALVCIQCHKNSVVSCLNWCLLLVQLRLSAHGRHFWKRL